MSPIFRMDRSERYERQASLLAGAGMVLYAIFRPSRLRLPFLLGGGYLLYKGGGGQAAPLDGIAELLGLEQKGTADPGTGLDRSGAITVERAFTINRARADVYAYWRQLENLPNFMKHLISVEETGMEHNRPKSHWKAKGPLGTEIDWDAVIEEEVDNERISWRSLPGSEIENAGIVKFNDAPGGRGTEVKVKLQYSPPGGKVSAVVAKLLGEEPGLQIRDDLRRFKEMMEARQIATTFGQTSGRGDEVEQQRDEIRRHKVKDEVQEASEQSFPASDPPAWVNKRKGEGNEEE